MSRKLVVPTILLAAIITAHFFIPNADAVSTTKYNILAVEYSQSCQTMITHGDNSTCPTLDKIWKYDTSNKNISGKLLWNGKEFIRTNPQVKNHYVWYETMKVCVGCDVPLGNPDLFKTIFIEPSGFTYVIKDQEIKNSHTITTFTNPYISPDCMTATVGYTDFLLNDTIHYILNGCIGNHFINNQTSTTKDTPADYKDSISYKQKAYVDAALKINKGNCISKKCDTVKDPFKKARWG